MNSPLRYIGRVLTFRFTGDDVANVDLRHLAVGLLFTWAAGVGRYWDNPRVSLLQHLGLGSLIYVFALSAFLWLLFLPLRPARWSYRHVLTFITAVSPPALLYAIPVERFMSLADARVTNFWFLAVVAVWRVALYVVFLWRYARFEPLPFVVASILPLTIIVFALTALNLERAVFDLMAGNEGDGTSADDAYGVLFLLSFVSFWITPVMLLLYFVAIHQALKRKEVR